MAGHTTESRQRNTTAKVERVSLSRVLDVPLPREFKKATGAIHIAPKTRITLLQRKIFNVLLASAVSTRKDLDQQTFSVSLHQLMEEVEFDSNNTAHIKEALKQLNVLQVQWEVINELGKDEWGVATMIAEAKIVDGRIWYSFAPRTKDMLLNPEVYARISLEMQRQFHGQYAYALYENCVRFVDVRKTTLLPVVTWRNLLGASSDYYDEFKNFSRKILKPAMEEVNTVSDITIKALYVYEGRAVTNLQFEVERKSQRPLILGGVAIDSRLEKKLRELGCTDEDISVISATYEAEFIWSTIAQFEEVATKGGAVSKPASYLKTMLKNNKKPAKKAIAKKAAEEPAAPAPAPVAKSSKKDKKGMGMEELQIEFNAHRRERAKALYDEMDKDEQQALQRLFAESDNMPAQVKESYRKSGLRSKLVSTAFNAFLQEQLLTSPEDSDILHFAVANGLVGK